jgi:uncharacterized membrane protein YhhN
MVACTLYAVIPEVLTAATVAGVVGLLVADARGAPLAAAGFKAAASLCFVLVAVVVGALRGASFSGWVFAGLVLSAGGDVALAVPSQRAFLAGLGLFLLAHVAYVVAFSLAVPPTEWWSVAAAAPFVFTLIAYIALAPKLGSMRNAVIAYMAAITVMVIGAMAVRRSGHARGDLVLAGALLFYVSDLSVARDRFVASGFVNRLWGLPAYYAGQLLLAWATSG